jgi:hypothetical protein
VACAVSALLGAVVLGILLPGMRHGLSLRARAHLSQEAMLVLQRLEQDVRPCSRATLALLPGPNGDTTLALRQLTSVSGYRGQSWNTWVLYRWSGRVLSRLDNQSLPVVGFALPNASMLDEVFSKAPARRLGPHLNSFQCTPQQPTQLMRVELRFEDVSQPNRPVRLQVERLLAPRNALRSGT